MDSRAVSVEAKRRGSVCHSQYLHVVRKTGPVVSSQGEATAPFTQNASGRLTRTRRPLRTDTVDSRTAWSAAPLPKFASALLAGSSLIPRDRLLNVHQCRGPLPVPSASQSALTLRLAPACPLPTAQTATPWILPSAAQHPPTLSLSRLLCLSGILPGWGTAAQVWGKRSKCSESGGTGLGCSAARTGFRSFLSARESPTFISALAPLSPAQGWAARVS